MQHRFRSCRRLAPAVLFLLVTVSAGEASQRVPRSDPGRDRAVISGMASLSEWMRNTHLQRDGSFAYDFFVPCLNYADARTARAAQDLILRQVDVDARGKKVSILGKLDHHAAYKGRDRLRAVSLDAALEVLSDPPRGRERGYGLLYLCALTTRFEHTGADYNAAAGEFAAAYQRLADDSEVFDLPLAHALSGAEFWPSDEARRRLSALGVARAESVSPRAATRKALMLAYAALAHPDDAQFRRLATQAEEVGSDPDKTLVRVITYSRNRTQMPPSAAAQLELLRVTFLAAPIRRSGAEFLSFDHFDRLSVTISASLIDFLEARGSDRPSRGSRFAVLGIGAPQASAAEIACLTQGDCPPDGGGRFRSAAAGPVLDPAPLPETAVELVAMREALEPVDATLLLGPEARVEALKKALERPYDVISFATHGVPAHRLEGVGLIEPALLLGLPREGPGAFLGTSEIGTLDLKGRPLVVISACDTARAGNGSLHFDALSGFYQAFRLAGAEGVLATQWEVASEAAEKLIPDFIARLRGGDTFSRALRDAKIRLRDSSPEALRHPGYWMPFVYLGDGAARLLN